MTVTLSPENILEAVSSSSESSSGCSQKFVKLTDEWGVKIFSPDEHGDLAKSCRDIAYERQKAAAAIGYGPEVGDKFDLPNGEFGYVTEIVELFNPYLANNKFGAILFTERYPEAELEEQELPTNECFDRLFLRPAFENKVSELKKAIAKTGFKWYDAHGGNIGWKNDRLICIDFY